MDKTMSGFIERLIEDTITTFMRRSIGVDLYSSLYKRVHNRTHNWSYTPQRSSIYKQSSLAIDPLIEVTIEVAIELSIEVFMGSLHI